jgi:hypothetical protein
MLKLPPPIWALFYLIVAAAISDVAGWPRIPGLPLAGLGILLILRRRSCRNCGETVSTRGD